MTAQEQSYRTISLTQNQVAIVDEQDYEFLSQWKWYAHWNPGTKSYYAGRNSKYIKGERRHAIWMHREILGLERGDLREADHIKTGETLDNRRSNLRITTHADNCKNRRRRSNSVSGFKGVTFHPATGKWRAQIWHEKRNVALGLYLTKEEAHAAYCAAVPVYHGEFGRER